jgi:predicted RND superfamily exporter protein
MVLAEMKEIISHDFIVATILAVLGVCGALFLQFREIRGVLFCAISLGMGVLWMVGIMGLLGISLNFANVVAMPMVIGIGIDDNIHLYHRFREKGKGGVISAVTFSGRAIVMTTLTTIAGFGSLTLARYGGLSSIGILSVLGVILCLLSALFVMPALLAIGTSRGDNNEAE